VARHRKGNNCVVRSGSSVLTLRLDGRAVELAAGDSLTFGRGDGSDPGHLALSQNPKLHAQSGRIEVEPGGWLLTNTGRWLHVRVVELDGPNRVDLQPGRIVRVPYAHCRIEVTTGDETVGFEAWCPVLADTSDGAAGPAVPLAGSTVTALGLDRSAGYFRALVALCAPRLRDPQTEAVAAVGEIVRTLNALPTETERVTAKAIERRLAHVRSKVGLAASDPYGGSAAGLEVRDAARQLADLVIRTGVVTEADLALVDPDASDPAP
jgi:hypothetical protein